MAAWSENCKWYNSLPLGAVVSLFNEFCRHNPLCCFPTSACCCCCLFRYDSVRKLLDTPSYFLEFAVFWVVAPRSVVVGYQRCCIKPEDGGSKILRNVKTSNLAYFIRSILILFPQLRLSRKWSTFRTTKIL
jgi:hypothetical protein